MQSLIQSIKDAEAKKIAIGHFNISTVDALWGIFHGAKKLNMPIIIGVSEGERDFIGVKQTVALVKSIREEYSYPIYLNADHTYSLERIREVVEAGFDSVIFDGAKLNKEENLAKTKEAVEYVKSVNPEILVEAEIGYIGSSSKMLDEIPEGATADPSTMPTGAEAKNFVLQTGVDLISPAVGNIHGMLKHAQNPELNIQRIREIHQSAGVPLVLHGGSGISDQNFTEAIQAGISVIHINTEIRKAWRDATETSLAQNPDEVSPYKILQPAMDAVEQVVEQRLKLFSGME